MGPFEVTAVPSAEDALDALDGRAVDVLLTDQRLPGMDGVQLITRIRATHPALAIIVMTAYPVESALEARSRGADDYLPKLFLKLFEVPDLLSALHRALDQQKSPACGRLSDLLAGRILNVGKPNSTRGGSYGR